MFFSLEAFSPTVCPPADVIIKPFSASFFSSISRKDILGCGVDPVNSWGLARVVSRRDLQTL